MPCLGRQSPHFLDGRQRPVVVKAGNGIVNDDDLVRKIGILIKRRKEERQRQGIAVAGAEGVAERRRPWRGGSAGNGHRHVVNHHAIGAGRAAPRVGRCHLEAGSELLQVEVDGRLISWKNAVPIGFKRSPGRDPCLFRDSLCRLFGQIIVAQGGDVSRVPRLHCPRAYDIGRQAAPVDTR